ncbi:MAG: hypothetical protein JXA57_17415 [Armatimonadetes bacterium]|nr:hypothetical protein [Armatimonadota bacterium]
MTLVLPITVNVALVFAIVYGVLTHRRWLWISAGTVFVLWFLAFLLLSGLGGSAGVGYEVK